MKRFISFVILAGALSFLAACQTSNTREINGERYAKKIYLTKEDYLEDLMQTSQRRELQPNKESEYIFNVVPQMTEDTSVYFFDRHQQPKVPGQYTAQDYKNEKRLWKKPKRYTPEQYYGMQDGGGNDGGTGSEEDYEP